MRGVTFKSMYYLVFVTKIWRLEYVEKYQGKKCVTLQLVDMYSYIKFFQR